MDIHQKIRPMPHFNPLSIEEELDRCGIKTRIIKAEDLMKTAIKFKQTLLADEEWMNYYKGIIADKWIEHFLSTYFLSPKDGDVIVDIASHWSPFQKVIQKLFNVKVLRQDQIFKPGINDSDIGSDCTAIPLPDNSINALAVNNSIEHFEQDKDTLFIKEANRLLKPGGCICLVPLFINSTSVNMVDPSIDLTDLVLDDGAIIASALPWKIRFARFYTPKTYKQRLMDPIPQLKHEIYSIHGMNNFDESLGYWQFVSLIKKVNS